MAPGNLAVNSIIHSRCKLRSCQSRDYDTIIWNKKPCAGFCIEDALTICVSTILCTHNPRSNYLGRVLEALCAQTLPLNQWELLLVDNASRQPIAPAWNLSWHPHARHVHEDRL